MRLSEPTPAGHHGVLALAGLRLHIASEPELLPYVSSVIEQLNAGYSPMKSSSVTPLDVVVSLKVSAGTIAQDTPHGRYVHEPDGSYLSRWGFWDVRLSDFKVGSRPSAELQLSPDVSRDSYADGIRMFLRTVVASAAPLIGSLMFHGCALADPQMGRGLLFLGASGEGKTTMASRLDSWVCLGDDTVLLHYSCAEGIRVSGTPFAGSEGNPRIASQVPLREVYFLRPGSRDLRIKALKPDESFGQLMRRLMWFVDGGPLRESMLDLMTRLASSLSASRLESSLQHDIRGVFERPPC